MGSGAPGISEVNYENRNCRLPGSTMKNLIKENYTPRRIIGMLLGIMIMSFGLILFKLSLMGNGPSTSMVIAIADRIGIDFAIVMVVSNCLFFAVEWLWNKKLIGIGTFVNWFLIGPLASLYERGIRAVWDVPAAFLPRLMLMAAGILVLSLASSFYQTADVGIAPYDALSITISEKSGRQYFICRILTDGICVTIAWLLGGIVGIGTLVCAFGLGPFVQFFSRHIAKPLIFGD